MTFYVLDKRDKDLLILLYADSRMSFTEMGKRLKVSGSTVERRIAQLEKAGIITLLFANVNLTKIGFKSYRIYLKFDVFNSETEREVLDMFESYPNTLWGAITEGPYDVLWRITARNELELDGAINRIMEKFGNRITEKTIITTIYQTYLPLSRILGGERENKLPFEKAATSEKIDDTDIKILAALYGNARETTVEIAKLVDLTPDAVNYRIRRLVKEGFILGYTAWYDARRLGFDYYKIFISFRTITKENEKSFLVFCAQNGNVVFLNKCIGSWDIEVDVIVETTLELHKFILEIRTRFGQIIGKQSYVSIIDERMLNPLREYMEKHKD
jgi:DNA-binding Lrp family transcriptional regulator